MRAPCFTALASLLALAAGCGGSSPADSDSPPEPTDAGPTADAEPEPEPEPEPPGLRVRFAPDAEGFFRTPWPSDARLTEAGTPDLTDFPVARPTLQKVVDEIEARIDGFANMPIVYFAFDDPIAEAPLPTPADSLSPDAVVQMLALGPRCGERVPIESAVRLEPDAFIEADVLQVKNTVGTVLPPRVPHAVVVLDHFGGDPARPTTRPEAFEAAWSGDGSRWAASLEPLRDCLSSGRLDLDPDRIAIGTVFTPQDPLSALQTLRDAVMDPDKIETRAPSALALDEVWSRERLNLVTWSGEVEFPVFQQGVTPYVGVGGAFVFDEAGAPVVQRWEPVPVAAAWRVLEPPPEGPRPALVFIDGTGWDPWSHLYSGWLNDALNAGYVVFSFMPQFHGERAGIVGGPEVPTFNLFNPTAGRTNFRQQAVEQSYFLRVIREQLDGFPGLPPFDAERVVYGGHSQGALAGALTAAVESEYRGYVFNGLSSYLTLTILFRKDLLDFELVIRGLFGADAPLDLFSPALHLMQIGSEAVDPHNFVGRWWGTPERPGNHVFVINGFNDDTTTPRGMDHLTVVGDLPIIGQPGWNHDPFGVGLPPLVRLPLQGNAMAVDGAPLTLATYTDPVQGHFTVYRSRTLRALALRFWDSARDGVPELRAEAELSCGDGGDGDMDGLTDCDDDDCANRWPCVEVLCEDGLDDDGNGLIDCDDPRCGGDAERAGIAICEEMDCADGLDDDEDGLIDCADPGCATRAPCAEEICSDREDDDGDGLIDCDDPECEGRRDCLEFDCSDLRDNNRDGLTDCEDPACLGSLECPEPACDDGTDEDGNGLADCADPRCAGTEACPVTHEGRCDDGLDDDDDGAIDCADLDCAVDASCAAETCADGDLGQAVGVAIFGGTLEERPDTWAPGDCTRLGSGKDAPDLALRWTAPETGTYEIDTLGSAIDTVLTIYPDDCDRARELGCNDDRDGVRTSRLSVEIEAGTSVVLVISGYEEEDAGPVRLSIYQRPAEVPE